jgi:hypothetical protein
VRRVHQSTGNFVLQTRQANVETGREAVSAASCAQVHFGVNRHVRWEGDLPFSGRKLYRTEETGGPTRGKELLGVGAGARAARRGQLNLKSPIIGARGSALPATRGMGLGGVEHFFDFRHGGFLYLFESGVFLSEELVGCAYSMTLFDLHDDLNDDRCADWQTLNAVHRPHMAVFGAEELNEQI